MPKIELSAQVTVYVEIDMPEEDVEEQCNCLNNGVTAPHLMPDDRSWVVDLTSAKEWTRAD